MDRSFFRFVTKYAFDGRTDGQTDGQTDSFLFAIDRVCIPCTVVKINAILLYIKINQPKLVDRLCFDINWQQQKNTKFHGNILSLSENIAKYF